MNGLKRAALGLAGGVLIVVIGLVAYVGRPLLSTKPTFEGELLVAPGPAAPVTITRDAHGVPHIFGETEADVFFGLGYVHADERFFAMDMVRRFVFGRLSEALGEATLAVDARSHILGYPGMARSMFDALDEATRTGVEAYVAGVNARLARGNPSFEHWLLGLEPEPYRVQDVMAFVVYMADDLTVGLSDQTDPLRYADVLSEAQIASFLPPYPPEGPTTLRPEDVAAGTTTTATPDPGDALEGPAPGSNAWVIGPARSTTGKPILANDPHLGLRLPSLWYLARLALPDGDVVGVTLPGAPLVVLGRNEHIAWGFTNTGFDVIDLVPLSPDFAPVETRTVTIPVKGTDPVELEVQISDEGPVLDPQWFPAARPFGQPVAWRSTMSRGPSRVPQAMYRLMKATDWESFVEAGRGWTAPMQNMLFASDSGDIGYTTAGLLPIRGEDGRWTGFVPYEALPRVLNPSRGWLATGNNRVTPDTYPYPVPGRYVLHRVERIEALLLAREKHAPEDLARMQMDVTSALAERLIPVIRDAKPATEAGRAAQARLAQWTGEMASDAEVPRLYAAWYRAIHPRLYADELGEKARLSVKDKPVFIQNVLVGDDGAWCDDVRTERKESCAEQVGAALDEAAEVVAAGPWGAVHRAKYDHPVLGRIPGIGGAYRLRAAMGGDGTTVNVGDFGLVGDYEVSHGASYRAVYDLSDLDRSRYVHAPGQSGHILSPHFDDLLELWRTGQGIEIPTSFGRDDGRKLILRAR